jgi:hypothetical protein
MQPKNTKPQIQIPVSTEPVIMTARRFIPTPKRRIYVDAEEMSWHIEQISLSLSPTPKVTRENVWPMAFLYKV